MHSINILSTVYDNTVDEFIESYNTWVQTDRWDNIFVVTQADMLEDNLKKLMTSTNAILINEQEFVPAPLLTYGGWITQQFRKLFFSTVCPSDYYLCVDSDTKYINDIQEGDLFTEGMPNLYSWTNPNLEGLTNDYNNYTINGVNEPHDDEWYELNRRAHHSFSDTTRQLLGFSEHHNWYLSGAFLMCCKTVEKLLAHLTTRYVDYITAFNNVIASSSQGFNQGKLSEYTLYGTFVQHYLAGTGHHLTEGCLAHLYFNEERAKNATSPFVTIHKETS